MTYLPSTADLDSVFSQKYGDGDRVGWNPRRRRESGYYLPSDVYEATISNMVTPGCSWLDVGGGHEIFPENNQLASTLVSRCSRVVSVDPSDNIKRNTLAHEVAQCRIEEFVTDERFELATLRMVVEHVDAPQAVVSALHRLLRPNGLVAILTVNAWSPVPLISRLTPFRLHYPIKRALWGFGDEADTFPVRYLMNTRPALAKWLSAGGFQEEEFAYLDDLSTFIRTRHRGNIELFLRTWCRNFHLHYPENCLLGIYRRSAT